jgi:heme a synthase
MNRFQRWALATTIATYMLISIGGMVRASDAGLGCPDWPKCFDRFYPPLSAEQLPDHISAEQFDFRAAWIEYVNRLVGVVIGFLILGTSVLALRNYRQTPRVLFPTVAAFILVLFQGWLGGQVVESQLNPMHITAHLVMAWIIVSLLLYATVNAFFPNSAPFANTGKQRRFLGNLVLLLMFLTLIQAGLGANLRGELEVIEKNNPALARADWLGEAGFIDTIHRSFSWLLLGTLAWINVYVWRRLQGNKHLISQSLVATNVLVFFQIAVGVGLAYGGLPPVLQALHLIGGSLLIGGIMLLYLLAGRVPVEAPEAPQNSTPQSTNLTGQTA